MRLFIGIDLPDKMKQNLFQLQSELRGYGVKGSWKAIENLHITLEFLGELESDAIPILTNSLSKVTSNHKPFNLSIKGLGAFPSLKKPNILWSALEENLILLHHLRDELHTELIKSGYNLEERPFKPHITLVSRPKLEAVDLAEFHTKKIGEFTVKDVVLFESRHIKGKLTYIDLFRVNLPLF
ncbi:3'-5' RNA ligase LigT [Clostridium aceticum]|uniref:RNA 2',3'-cyclic phosphodiesterase n=1 Tax=Clostridium aceticum TaxID=84022 RepID=A0A0D8IBD4_9CLOT|nr:RNA 2',3'-cyclic phosphodiesterase [Clostridium aceticum]AKL96850.1 3'-5' RNA ligase LigT [Clostridium aceticum]KJF27593.1 2'-5' RNA ligase [Clostridium aceticum]